MKKVFVSGSFNVLHAGHIRFFRDASALGDYLIVSFPPADLLWKLYDKKSLLDDADKMALLRSLQMVLLHIFKEFFKKSYEFNKKLSIFPLQLLEKYTIIKGYIK